ncbi:MAG: glutamate racemase [Actinobacteria bacterium]|nr:glutamate racemase [Actinomycetota bacterium]
MSEKIIDANKPIGVFDSGIGGLTVVKEIRRFLPHEDILYLGDTLRCPYGPRPLPEVRKYAIEISEFLYKKGIKALVVACNTASSAALEDLKERYPDIPVLGVVEPGARAALLYTKNKRVGVIGTVGTIGSGAYEKALKTIDQEVIVISKATPELVDYVERGEISGPRIEAVVRNYLSDMLKSGLDTLILGCTHYPLIQGVIEKVVGAGVKVVSSASETARELNAILSDRRLLKTEGNGKLKLMVTDGSEIFLSLGREFLGQEVREVYTIKLKEVERV